MNQPRCEIHARNPSSGEHQTSPMASPDARTKGKGHTVIGTIVGAIVVGLIIGVLARLVMPGKQNIGIIITTVLGALGSLIGTWLSYTLGYSNENGGFEIIPFLVGIIVAVVLIAAYLGITGRRHTMR
jgi:uncharacterized membrane protein YeaQ/YmgE (transglycosylase-associated protein family)